MKAQAKTYRTYLVSKENKNRYYVTLSPVEYNRDRASRVHRELQLGIPVRRIDIFWARAIGKKLLRLKTDPDFFSSEGQHKMEASNAASNGKLKSFVMHLAPAKSSGYEVCIKASEGCTMACLNTSGHGAICNVQAGRLKRTRLYFEHREIFCILLFDQLSRLSKRKKYSVAIRLNGTSDIPWEIREKWIFAMFTMIQFYDYSAIPGRFQKSLPENYHLTFSRKENNHETSLDILSRGFNVAMVFAQPIYKAICELGSWCGHAAIDGAADDRRWLDPSGSIVALKPLGKAKHDRSGFVLRPSLRIVGGIL